MNPQNMPNDFDVDYVQVEIYDGYQSRLVDIPVNEFASMSTPMNYRVYEDTIDLVDWVDLEFEGNIFCMRIEEITPATFETVEGPDIQGTDVGARFEVFGNEIISVYPDAFNVPVGGNTLSIIPVAEVEGDFVEADSAFTAGRIYYKVITIDFR